MVVPSACRGRAPLPLTRLACWSFFACLGLFLALGCQGKSDVGPQFRIEDQETIDKEIERGKRFQTKDPYALFAKTTQRTIMRISPNVIVLSAALVRPQDEVAFAVASLPRGADDFTVKKAVDEALPLINQRLRFVVVLQLVKTADPKLIQFEMRTSGNATYPPMEVPQPQLLQELPGSLEGDVPASAVYRYQVYFQTAGSPGYPALGVEVTALDLTIKDGGAAGRLRFTVGGS